MTTAPRYLNRFTDFAGTISVDFPLMSYEYSPQQQLIRATRAVTGADYAIPLRGNIGAVKDVGIESAHYVHGEDTLDTLESVINNLRAIVYEAAVGWLYTIDHNGVERRARAAITAVPEASVSYQGGITVVSSVNFQRYSDWLGPDIHHEEVEITVGGQTFTITVPGNARVFDAVITYAGVFSNPGINNLTSGYTVASIAAGASSDDVLRYDAGQNRVEKSADGGATYAPDYANFVRPIRQVQLMRLNPGDNNWSVLDDDVPNALLSIDYYEHWH